MADLVTIQQYNEHLASQGRLLDHRFGLTITRSGMEDFSLFGQSTNLPERTLKTASLHYYGLEMEIPTTLDEGRRWSVELHTDRNNAFYNRMRKWQEEYSSWQRSGGGYKGITSIQAYIDLYDDYMTEIVDSFTLNSICPLEVGQITLDHSGNDLASFSVNFLFLQSWNNKRDSNPMR